MVGISRIGFAAFERERYAVIEGCRGDVDNRNYYAREMIRLFYNIFLVWRQCIRIEPKWGTHDKNLASSWATGAQEGRSRWESNSGSHPGRDVLVIRREDGGIAWLNKTYITDDTRVSLLVTCNSVFEHSHSVAPFADSRRVVGESTSLTQTAAGRIIS
jgi:hypothetical protein